MGDSYSISIWHLLLSVFFFFVGVESQRKIKCCQTLFLVIGIMHLRCIAHCLNKEQLRRSTMVHFHQFTSCVFRLRWRKEVMVSNIQSCCQSKYSFLAGPFSGTPSIWKEFTNCAAPTYHIRKAHCFRVSDLLNYHKINSINSCGNRPSQFSYPP